MLEYDTNESVYPERNVVESKGCLYNWSESLTKQLKNKKTMTPIKSALITALLLSSFILCAQKKDKAIAYINTDTIPVYLNTIWKYHQGDDINWAKHDFDDSTWDTIAIALNLDEIPKETFTGNCWFRLRVVIDSSLVNLPLGLTINHTGASEIYINGKLVHQYGKIGLNKINEKPYSPDEIPIGFVFDQREYHTIAVRYSNHRYFENYNRYEENKAGLSITINKLNETVARETRMQNILMFTFMLLFGILFTLSFVHFLLYIFYKKHKVNFYYSLFTFFFSMLFFYSALLMVIHIPFLQLFIEYYIYMLIPLMFFMLITFLYSLFYSSFPKIFWVVVVLTFITLLFFFVKVGFNDLIITIQALFVIVEAIRVIIRAMIKKHKGANILGVGIFLFALFIIGIVVTAYFSQNNINITISGPLGLLLALFLISALLSIPISMSVYLAKDFATINAALEDEKEKLEQRVIERTTEVVAQKNLLEEKNSEIIASIRYAKRIQDAFMTSQKYIERNMNRLKSLK